MAWSRARLFCVVLVEAGWLTFDGARALVAGDYVTRSSGPHAGELGPWSRVLGAVGIPPRATAVKIVFLTYGLVWLATATGFVRGASGLRPVLVALAAGMLWYVPVGTVLGLVQLAIFAFVRW
jgi:hypothetical protein